MKNMGIHGADGGVTHGDASLVSVVTGSIRCNWITRHDVSRGDGERPA